MQKIKTGQPDLVYTETRNTHISLMQLLMGIILTPILAYDNNNMHLIEFDIAK